MFVALKRWNLLGAACSTGTELVSRGLNSVLLPLLSRTCQSSCSFPLSA